MPLKTVRKTVTTCKYVSVVSKVNLLISSWKQIPVFIKAKKNRVMCL